MPNWLNRDNFAVLGLGRSGVAALRLLGDLNKDVIASDTADRDELSSDLEKLPDSVQIETGGHRLGNADVAVISPGIPPDAEIVREVRNKEIPIISEVELAFDATDASILGITGTDGKTTTTELLGSIYNQTDNEFAVGGNIGTPLSEVVSEVSDKATIVAEVSAFQLWSTFDFRVETGGVTNIAEDHLDYFGQFSDYIEAKKQLLNNQGADDWIVLNGADPELTDWSSSANGRILLYAFEDQQLGRISRDISGIVRTDTQSIWLELTASPTASKQIDISEANLRGRHNIENMMCAAAMALTRDIDTAAIEKAFRTFETSSHRFEYIGVKKGVQFIDDSKATNVNSALAGLRSLEEHIVPIVGGKDKGLKLDELTTYLTNRDIPVVVMGDIQDRLIDELQAAGKSNDLLFRAKTMREAVQKAVEKATPGETVILSPACSSFDMYDSYAHRGRVFQKAVEDL